MAEDPKSAETYDDRPVHAEVPLPPEGVQAPLAVYRGEGRRHGRPSGFKDAIAQEPGAELRGEPGLQA